MASLLGLSMPVELPGRFVRLPGSDCRTTADGLAADCTVDKGRVLAVADAALLDDAPDSEHARAAMLDRLVTKATR